MRNTFNLDAKNTKRLSAPETNHALSYSAIKVEKNTFLIPLFLAKQL